MANETTIPVPYRFEPIGTAPLANSSDIYDATKNKSQSEINVELYQKVQDIDATPTYGSGKAVSSNGVFSELADLGRDVNLMSSVGGTEVVDSGSRLTPADYKAGDIFYVEEGNEGQNFSQFVYGVKYYVAKADGNAGDDLDSNLFDNTYSGAHAVQMSLVYNNAITYADVEVCEDIIDDLT